MELDGAWMSQHIYYYSTYHDTQLYTLVYYEYYQLCNLWYLIGKIRRHVGKYGGCARVLRAVLRHQPHGRRTSVTRQPGHTGTYNNYNKTKELNRVKSTLCKSVSISLTHTALWYLLRNWLISRDWPPWPNIGWFFLNIVLFICTYILYIFCIIL